MSCIDSLFAQSELVLQINTKKDTDFKSQIDNASSSKSKLRKPYKSQSKLNINSDTKIERVIRL